MLEILAYPAVNCFLIVSGFVGFREEKYYPRIKNLISLFFVVLFYSVTICSSVKLFISGSLGVADIIRSFSLS